MEEEHEEEERSRKVDVEVSCRRRRNLHMLQGLSQGRVTLIYEAPFEYQVKEYDSENR